MDSTSESHHITNSWEASIFSWKKMEGFLLTGFTESFDVTGNPGHLPSSSVRLIYSHSLQWLPYQDAACVFCKEKSLQIKFPRLELSVWLLAHITNWSGVSLNIYPCQDHVICSVPWFEKSHNQEEMEICFPLTYNLRVNVGPHWSHITVIRQRAMVYMRNYFLQFQLPYWTLGFKFFKCLLFFYFETMCKIFSSSHLFLLPYLLASRNGHICLMFPWWVGPISNVTSFSTCRQLEGGAVGSAVGEKRNAFKLSIHTSATCEDVSCLICITSILWHVALQNYGTFHNNYQWSSQNVKNHSDISLCSSPGAWVPCQFNLTQFIL